MTTASNDTRPGLSSLSTESWTSPEVSVSWKNPHSLITAETSVLVQQVLFCYVSPVIFCVGVPTNVLNCVVFARQGLKDRMNLCLFCLSLVDLLFVAIHYWALGLYCFVELIRPDITQWWKWSGLKHMIGLYRGFMLSSGCLTMIIAVERCVCVLFPLKASSLMKTRAMGLLIVCVVGLVHLLCIIFPLKVDIQLVTNVLTNDSDYALVPSELYHASPTVFDVIENIVLMTFVPFFNFVVVGLATLVTVVQLKRMIAWRSSSSTAKDNVMTRQQVVLVKMLVVVSFIFILTSCPFVALSIATMAEPEFFLNGRYANLFLATHGSKTVLFMINSSINFFVYVCRSSKFREELQRLFCLSRCSPLSKEGTHDAIHSFQTKGVSFDEKARTQK